jgi:hypothetical protein
MPITSRNRVLAFAGLCIACLAVAVVYVVLTRENATGDPGDGLPVRSDPAAFAEAQKRPHVLFRNTTLGNTFGQLALAPLDALDGPRYTTGLTCERVHFAAGAGLCLSANRGVITTYHAQLFDSSQTPGHATPLGGVPSRARVSPDGRLAALTYFVNGDSYAAGGFSTRTLIVDTSTGGALANLEELKISRDGEPFESVDFNFWGVTFSTAPNVFYSTLSSGGKMHLIRGDVAARTGAVIGEAVECPSLSPDNTRVAFKRRMPGIRLLWRIHVLDLETGEETMLSETRSVDDQVEWLDDQTILYGLPNEARKASPSMDVWAVPADGTGSPRLFLRDADSPAVVRQP